MTIPPAMLGRIGQSVLAKFAAQAKVTANASFHDERGWDCLLEISSDAGKGPLDRAPPELSCMLQIKTTAGADASEAIKLSNWRRMCSPLMPWFVFVVRVNDDEEPTNAHLVHIGKEWCEKALRRLRELSVEKDVESHERRMMVTWSDADKLPKLHGRALLAKIREHIGANQQDYLRQKAEWHQELGYDDSARRISLTLRTEDSETLWRELGNLGIGLRSTMPGDWTAAISDVRFGIEAQLDAFGRESGEMELYPPSQGKVSLALASGVAHAPTIECELFRATAAFPFIPREHDKVRLVSKYMSCVFTHPRNRESSGQMGAFTFTLPADEHILLGDVRSITPAMRLLMEHNNNPVSATVSSANSSITLSPGGVGQIEKDSRRVIELLEALVRVCDWFNVADEAKVSLSSALAQRDMIRFADKVVGGDRLGETGPVTGPYRDVVPLGELFAATTDCVVHLADCVLACVIGLYGPVTGCEERPGGGARVTADRVRITVEKFVVSDENADDSMLVRARSAVQQRLRDLGCLRIAGHTDQA